MPGIFDTSHVQATEAWVPPATIGESFDAAFEQQSSVDAFLGFGSSVRDSWEANVRAYSRATGQPINDKVLDSNALGLATNSIINPSHPIPFPGPLFEVYSGNDSPDERAKQINELNQQIKKLNNPNIKTLEEIIQQSLDERRDIEQRLAQTSESGGVGNFFARLAGSVAGSFTGTDPIAIGTLFTPSGFGKGPLGRIASEIAIGASTEYAVQEQVIQPTRQSLGEEEGDVFWSVVAAGLGAGIFRGLLIEPAAAAFARRPRIGEIELDFTDPQLAQMFQQTPTTRAAQSVMEDAIAFRTFNPYGSSEPGVREFTGEITDIYNLMSGRTDTAIARFLPAREFNVEQLDFNTQVVRSEQPAVFNRVVEVQGRLNELDTQIAGITQQIDNPKASEVLQAINPTLAERVGAIERQIAEGDFTDARRGIETERLRGEAITLVERETGTAELRNQTLDLIERSQRPGLDQATRTRLRQEAFELSQRLAQTDYGKAVSRRETSLRDDLAKLRRERARTVREYNSARDRLDREIKLVDLKRIAREAAQAVTAPGPRTDIPYNPANLRRDVVVSHIADTDAAVKTLDDDSVRLIRAEVGEEGAELPIDIEARFGIPEGFEMPDPGNPEKSITAKALIKDLQEDDKLVQQMKVCSS